MGIVNNRACTVLIGIDSMESITRIVRAGFLPIQERDENNNVVREYVWGPSMGGGIGGLLAMKENGSTYYYLYDGKGNVTAVTDSSGNLVATYTYDPFGVLTESSGMDQPFRFSTKRYDEQTGLSYYGYRFYSASLGRWMTRDPLGEAGGVNLYGFIGNNAINGVDPLGLDPRPPSGAEHLLDAQGANSVLRCHVNPHLDPKENAIGGLLVGGPIVAYGAAEIGASSIAYWQALQIEVKVMTGTNVFKIISKGRKVGFRVDKAHHGKRWGHMKYWRW